MEWINCKDKLPETTNQHRDVYASGYLLGYSIYNEIEITQLINHNGKYQWDCETGFEDLDYITHWMELPKPPIK